MSHIRTQIRAAFKAALEAHADSGDYAIFASRKYRWNSETGPMIDIMVSNDQTEPRSGMGSARRKRFHVASVYLRVQRSAASDELDDLLDADELFITEAIWAATWTSLLEEDPDLLQVNFADSKDSKGATVGTIVIRFDVRYRIREDDPETAIH